MVEVVSMIRQYFWLGAALFFSVAILVAAVVNDDANVLTAIGFALAALAFFLAEVSDKQLDDLTEKLDKLTTRMDALEAQGAPRPSSEGDNRE